MNENDMKTNERYEPEMLLEKSEPILTEDKEIKEVLTELEEAPEGPEPEGAHSEQQPDDELKKARSRKQKKKQKKTKENESAEEPEGQAEGQAEGQTDGQTDGLAERQTERQVAGQTERQTDEQTDETKSEKGSWKKRKVLSAAEEPGYIRRSPARSWFNTFMIMNIPIIGWLYLLILAFGKKDQRKDFAKAYLIYKLVFLLVALAIIALLLRVGMDAADQLLQYMDML